ncbi:P-loop containing nucleoside triphosphate hydrolase protein [Infundibulicybe gibba]|nr:P-loop containing nucleoside triphosphate hydrolase protein [Infundibulicybe gibba]
MPSTRSGNSAVHVKPERVERSSARIGAVEQPEQQEEADEEEPEGEEDANGEEEDEVDAEGEEEEREDGAGSPRGHKRARVNQDGDSRPSDDGSQPPRHKVVTLPRDTDGYIPGSIVRIQLTNFVTYDYVQFCPGPYLNMILGPNGTGKSSIACAICLGLNWSPSILGRASDLNSFVKIGTESGHIEIELKGPKGKPNLVIRRNLSAKSKGSTFTLNGHSATGREITQKMADLNVQVGNLCSFLPQDKVSEFAAMSPQQLLRETQRAAGDANLTTWHDTLIEAGKDLKQMQQLIKDEGEQLKQMRERNEGIERDVQRYKDRKKIEHEIELLEVLIPVEKYREKREKFVEVKARQRQLHQRVTTLKAKNEPAHALLKKMDADHKRHDAAREDVKKSTRRKFEKMESKWTASEKLEAESEELTTRLDNIKKAAKERVKKIRNIEAEISRIQAELAKPVKLEKQEYLIDQAKQINLERSDVIARKGALEERLRFNIDQKAQAKVQLESANAELKKMDDVNNRKLQSIRQWDSQIHDAILWLRDNKHRFKMQVFEPPLMCLTVPDGRYVDAVESCFSQAQLKTFVAQCQEDLNTFNHFINDTTTLGRKVRVPTWFRPGNNVTPPPMSEQEMQQLGFDGYAIQYVDCPAGLRWFLQKELNLHRTAVALNGNNVDVNNAMHAVARSGGATFINGRTTNNVTRSRYGRQAVGNMTKDLRPGRNLVASAIDPQVKQRIDAAIADSRQKIAMADEERADLDIQLKDISAEDAVFMKRLDEIKAKREAIRREQQRLGSLQAKLDKSENSRTNLLNAPSADDERTQVKEELLVISKKRIKIAKEYTAGYTSLQDEIARSVITEQTLATRAGLQFLQVGANRAALQELCDKKDEKYQTALIEFNQVDEAFRVIKADSRTALEHSRNILSDADSEIREQCKEIREARLQYEKDLNTARDKGMPPPPADGIDLRTLDELQTELDMQRTNLELNLATNPGVVEQYEKRKRDIEQLEKTIEERQRKASKVERNIKHAMDNWKPALERLVGSIGQKFSAAFDRIGCAGEIRISENEDYEKWAIDILVKFRDNEKLQLLTGQRQSGGERSLTTILYLMSLTEEARAPFSLVDEINQGMDQRAERTVHNSMVEVTCKPDSAQYFLITPKLLPDLEYHERMKILCVNNGEWLPEERDLGNMMNMIEGFVRHRDRSTHAS